MLIADAVKKFGELALVLIVVVDVVAHHLEELFLQGQPAVEARPQSRIPQQRWDVLRCPNPRRVHRQIYQPLIFSGNALLL